jgi:CD109 antigen
MFGNGKGALIICAVLLSQLLSPTLLVGEAASAEYIMLAPKKLYLGTESSVSISSFSSETGRPVDRDIILALGDTGGGDLVLYEGRTGPDGHLIARFGVPDVEKGVYKLILMRNPRQDPEHNEQVVGEVVVADSLTLLIETDKPIYKPGQTVYGRVLALNTELKPVITSLNLSISDAKGIKVFRKALTTDDFGVASFQLSLADELNLGTWKIIAAAESGTSTVDVRVEKYVLPKFEVGIETPKDWFLVEEEIMGQVSADYFFGKPVDGMVEVKAYKYVADWENFATFRAKLVDGVAEFEIPAAGYLTGTVGSGGLGTVVLNVTVTDGAGHEERGNKMLKIAGSPTVVQIIPSSETVKPGLPLDMLIVTETPDGEPLEKTVDIKASYYTEKGDSLDERKQVKTFKGISTAEINIPEGCISAEISATVTEDGSETTVSLNAQYSPTGHFIHIKQMSTGDLNVGDDVTFEVLSTTDRNAYYDVVAGGRTIYSGHADGRFISFKVTPEMIPRAKLVAYVINPNMEVSADSLPFDVGITNPVDLSVQFSAQTSEPGDTVGIDLRSSAGIATVIGISIVDESVYALNEGRLNLQQIFEQLEKIFMEPQAEAHPEGQPIWFPTVRTGSKEVFEEAGVQVITSSSLDVPEGSHGMPFWRGKGGEIVALDAANQEGATVPYSQAGSGSQQGELAEVERVRQFFPETWYWNPSLMTDGNGQAHLELTVPDTITTWKLHAVSSSSEGIGMADSSLRVFQDFFVEPDLPYAVTRGEEFPVLAQIYNYLDTAQAVQVEIAEDSWFELVDERVKVVTIPGNSVASIAFTIRPKKVGQYKIEITARTNERADAVRRNIRIEPEGTPRESVSNAFITQEESVSFDLVMPMGIVNDSGRIMLSITPSLVGQTINGVEDLLGIPYGCGEQNMMFMAPDLEILRYLDSTGQINPEVRAKAEHYLTTGYQRELTFRRSDGSFSAFGQSDDEGSMFLTAFVLGVFSECREVMSIDQTVLSEAASWIASHQNANGSFSPVGFVCHQEMLGGLDPASKTALTAFVGIALSDYGDAESSLSQAVGYVESQVDYSSDPYALALGALLLEKVGSDKAESVVLKLLDMAQTGENGIFWAPGGERSNAVETTSYAALALMLEGRSEAEQAIRWIASQRNSLGGFCSTQDTVWALKALMTAARLQTRNIDSSIRVLTDGSELTRVDLTAENFDILNVVEIPLGAEEIELRMEGDGKVMVQLVKRYNVPGEVERNPDFELDVEYNTTEVEVDDTVEVLARAIYTGFYNSTGMMILDISIPTGFVPVYDTLDQVIADGLATRYEVAGRKVIFYVDDLERNEELEIGFTIRALFPVKAKGGTSTAYSYYKPEVRTESKGSDFQVSGEVGSKFGPQGEPKEPDGRIGYVASSYSSFPAIMLILVAGSLLVVFAGRSLRRDEGI